MSNLTQKQKETIRLAHKGIAEAQYNLALMFHEGIGVKQDYKLAAKWWTLAAKQGHEPSQYRLEWMHNNKKVDDLDG